MTTLGGELTNELPAHAGASSGHDRDATLETFHVRFPLAQPDGDSARRGTVPGSATPVPGRTPGAPSRPGTVPGR